MPSKANTAWERRVTLGLGENAGLGDPQLVPTEEERTADEANVTKCAEIAIVATASQRRSRERR